jgi:hypothetical protein
MALTTLHEIVTRRQESLQKRGSCCGRFDFLILMWRSPPRVEQLSEINDRKPLSPNAPTSEMKDDGSFHWSKQRVSRVCGGVVEEVRLIYAPILAFRGRFPNDPVVTCYKQFSHEKRTPRTVQPCPFL